MVSTSNISPGRFWGLGQQAHINHLVGDLLLDCASLTGRAALCVGEDREWRQRRVRPHVLLVEHRETRGRVAEGGAPYFRRPEIKGPPEGAPGPCPNLRQRHCTSMLKKPSTTRLDDRVLEVAQRLANAGRRAGISLT